MSFAIVRDIERLDGIPPQAGWLYVWISKYANKEGVCFPSIETLAKHCGMKKRQTRRWLKYLLDNNIIVKKSRYKGKRQTTNIFLTRGVIEDTLPPVIEDTQNSTTKDQDQFTTLATLLESRALLLIDSMFRASTIAEFEEISARIGLPCSPKQAVSVLFGLSRFDNVWELLGYHRQLYDQGVYLPQTKTALDKIQVFLSSFEEEDLYRVESVYEFYALVDEASGSFL